MKLKLDKYDIGLTKACATDVPKYNTVCVRNGELIAANGFILVVRPAEVVNDYNAQEALLPAPMLKNIKQDKCQYPEITVTDSSAKVEYKNHKGEDVEYSPSTTFKTSSWKYPDHTQLFSPKEKKARIAIDVRLLKQVLSCLPDGATLCLGITGENEAVEFICAPQSDRPIRGLIMPMHLEWEKLEIKWYRKEGEIN